MGAFKEPHGGELKELYLPEGKADEEKLRAKDYKSWDMNARQICDLDLLMNGAFSPLTGFLGEADYEGVCDDLRLESGVLWPIPVTLDVSEAFAGQIATGERIALRDAEGVLLATMDVEDIWRRISTAKPNGSTGRTTTCTRQWPTSKIRRGRCMSAAASTASSRPPTTTSSCCAIRPPNFAAVSASSAGARSWPSRRVIRCTVRTRN
jgi:hypothetical protein